MSTYTAVLIDTISIQDYVFGSNKLKENLGASYLVKNIYNLGGLKNKPLSSPEGYVGGGNALWFFNGEPKAKDFLIEWSTRLLVEFPGVKTAVAIGEIEFADENDAGFKNIKNELFEQLAANKFRYHPQVILPTHGLTATCSRTGVSMEDWIDAGDDSGYFSSISKAKDDAVDAATQKMYEDFPCVFVNGFKFTNELDELGSSKGEDSHIAIVHIDGNGMGKRFEECVTLNQTRQLSRTLEEEATKCCFDDLLTHIIKNYEKIKEEISIEVKKKTEAKIIPIRPIILGGDDITFVCDGRLGIYFAQIFLEKFQSKTVSDGKPISACAGVAITKLKYPFYRGYQIAEELCRNAKKKRKEKNDDGSWIDWHISYGGFSGTLDDIREQYKVTQGSLLMRPYKLIDNDSEISFYNLIKNSKQLYEKDKESRKQKFPNTKLKELREVLTLGEEAIDSFVNDIKLRKLNLPKFSNTVIGDKLFYDVVEKKETVKKTPYFDMIELAEIYPKFELK